MRGFTIASVIVLVVVVAVVGVAAILLARTVQEAQSINSKAQRIAKNGTGINESTDSVIQLTRTNKLAESILKSARPLDGQLGGIVNTARGIDGLAGSINNSAGSINTTAGSINTSAGSINSSADGINAAAGAINGSAGSINTSAGRVNTSAGRINTSAGSINSSVRRIDGSAGSINTSARGIDTVARSILGTARQIDTDVRLINQNLDVTLRLVTAVKGDTGNILTQAVGANDTAACIDRKLFGQSGDDGDCKGAATPQAREVRGQSRSAPATPDQAKLKKLRDLIDQANRKNPSSTPTPAPRTPAPTPAPTRGQQPQLPRPGELPRTPDQVNGILDLLPGLGQGQDRAGGRPGADLSEQLELERLFPGLGR